MQPPGQDELSVADNSIGSFFRVARGWSRLEGDGGLAGLGQGDFEGKTEDVDKGLLELLSG